MKFKDFMQKVLDVIPMHDEKTITPQEHRRFLEATNEGLIWLNDNTVIGMLLTSEPAGREISRHITENLYQLKHDIIKENTDMIIIEQNLIEALKYYVAAQIDKQRSKDHYTKMWSFLNSQRVNIVSSPQLTRGKNSRRRQFD